MIDEGKIDVEFAEDDDFDCSLSSDSDFEVDFGAKIGNYEGAYTVTPTDKTQVLLTTDKVLEDNITVNPIPSNYGLITWDGSTLTVS